MKFKKKKGINKQTKTSHSSEHDARCMMLKAHHVQNNSRQSSFQIKEFITSSKTILGHHTSAEGGFTSSHLHLGTYIIPVLPSSQLSTDKQLWPAKFSRFVDYCWVCLDLGQVGLIQADVNYPISQSMAPVSQRWLEESLSTCMLFGLKQLKQFLRNNSTLLWPFFF